MGSYGTQSTWTKRRHEKEEHTNIRNVPGLHRKERENVTSRRDETARQVRWLRR